MKYLFILFLSIISFICNARLVIFPTKIENAKDFLFASTKFIIKDSCIYSFSDNRFYTSGSLHFSNKYSISWTNYMTEERAKFNYENNIKLKENTYKADIVKTSVTCFILNQRNKAIKLNIEIMD